MSSTSSGRQGGNDDVGAVGSSEGERENEAFHEGGGHAEQPRPSAALNSMSLAVRDPSHRPQPTRPRTSRQVVPIYERERLYIERVLARAGYLDKVSRESQGRHQNTVRALASEEYNVE